MKVLEFNSPVCSEGMMSNTQTLHASKPVPFEGCVLLAFCMSTQLWIARDDSVWNNQTISDLRSECKFVVHGSRAAYKVICIQPESTPANAHDGDNSPTDW